MTIRPRGNSFMVDVKVGAANNPTKEPVRIRVTAADRVTANRLEAEIKAAVMKHGTWSPEIAASAGKKSVSGKTPGTLGAALQEAWDYPSGKRKGWKYQKCGKHSYAKAKACVDFLGADRHCATITSDDIDKLTKHFIETGNTDLTITHKIQGLFRVLWHAQRKGWITHRPFWDRPGPGNPREFIFSEALEEKVINYFGVIEHDLIMRDIFIIGIETGMRIGEILSSLASAWDIENRLVHVTAENSKNGKGRFVTLTQRAIDTVSPYLKGRKHDERIFRWNQHGIVYKMRKARAFCGMEKNREFCFHATRHTRATRLARKFRDPFLVMSQLGHSSIAVSMRYIKMAAMKVEEVDVTASNSVVSSLPHLDTTDNMGPRLS